MRRKRTETFVETRETIVVYQQRFLAPTCSVCFDRTSMVSPDLAAVLCRITTRNIYGLVEREEVHFTETEEGLLLICLPSLVLATEREGQYAATWPS